MASTSEELASQAERLEEIIAFFKVDFRAANANKTTRKVVDIAQKSLSASNQPKKTEMAVNSDAAGADIDLETGADSLDNEFEKI